jgi:AcrR family transcriptional regulator
MSATGVPAAIQHTAGDSGGSSPQAATSAGVSGGSSPQAGTSAGGSGGSSPRASTVPRPMRADAQRNYQRLLDAAVAVFAERGADDVSLEEIARRAGVGIGTLYRHFPTRQALLEAVYRDQVDGMRAKADELLESDSPSEALAEWLRALSAFSSTKRSLTAALLETLGKDSELLSACSAVIYGAADELLIRAKEAGAVRPDADGRDLMRLVHAVNIAAQHTPTDPGQRDRLIGIILDGLRPQG